LRQNLILLLDKYAVLGSMLRKCLTCDFCLDLLPNLCNFLALDAFNFELELFPLFLLFNLRLLLRLAVKFFFLSFKLNDTLL